MTYLKPILFALSLVLITTIVTFFAIRISRLKRLLQYVDMEIGRTTGREQDYWKKERKRLFRTFLSPFSPF